MRNPLDIHSTLTNFLKKAGITTKIVTKWIQFQKKNLSLTSFLECLQQRESIWVEASEPLLKMQFVKILFRLHFGRTHCMNNKLMKKTQIK